MSSLLMYGLIALALSGAVTGLLVTVHHNGVVSGRSEIQVAWDEATKKRRLWEEQRNEDASRGLEEDRGKARIVYRSITKEVDRIVERPVYRNVCLDAAGLRIARCAIRGESALECNPDEPVRPAAGSGGWNGGLRLTMDYTSVGGLP